MKAKRKVGRQSRTNSIAEVRRKVGRPKGSRTNSTAEVTPGTLGADLIVGIDNIAAYLGQPRRRIQHWANSHALPLMKTGALWCASKAVLRQHFSGGEAA
jgi:hypothetical protein